MLAHTCHSCGHDLSRSRAPLDPHYALPILICPSCSAAIVRRADGHRAIPRLLRRHIHAVRKLTEALLLLVIFSVGFVGICFALQASLENFRVPFFEAIAGIFNPEEDRAFQWRNDIGLVVFILWFVFTLSTGAYLTAAAPHSSRLRLITLWLIPTLVMLLLPAAIELIFDVVQKTRYNPAAPDIFRLPPQLRWYTRYLHQVFIGALVVMMLGIPVGHAIRASLGRLTARRFRRLRKRLIARSQRA